MARSITCTVALAALLILSVGTSHAAERTVYLGTLPGYPPFTFYKDGSPPEIEQVVDPGERARSLTGYSWDIARAAFHAVGYTVRIRVTPWARAMYELQNGKTDLLFPTGKNAERETYLEYSDGSVVDVDFLVYVRENGGKDYVDLTSLEGQTIAVMRGFNYGKRFNSADHFTRQPVDSVRQGFELLREGRVDGFAGYDVVWD